MQSGSLEHTGTNQLGALQVGAVLGGPELGMLGMGNTLPAA